MTPSMTHGKYLLFRRLHLVSKANGVSRCVCLHLAFRVFEIERPTAVPKNVEQFV